MALDPRLRGRPPVALAVALVATLFVLVGCAAGGAQDPGVATLTDPSASPDASAAPSMDPQDAMEAFAQCMRDHGVDIQVKAIGDDDGGPGTTTSGPGTGVKPGAGTDQDKHKLEQAQQDCQHLLPQGGLNGSRGQMDPETQDKLIAFSRCMREHGIDMPDPVFSNGGATVQIGGPGDDGPKLDPNSQAFKDAQSACESLLPGQLKGSTQDGPATETNQ